MNYLLLGKPNVGKSSIFNILTSNENIIHKDKGTTRDWHKKNITGVNGSFIYDSPGIFFKNNFINQFEKSNSFKKLLSEIDIFFYVIDYNFSLNNKDEEFIRYLRKYNKTITLIINKYDNFKKYPNIDFYKYGLSNIFLTSCSHKNGFSDLIKYIKKFSVKNNLVEEKSSNFSIAIFGKPNVGKSTLLNTILGFKRSNTSAYPGTTSDFVEDFILYNNYNIKIFDTAGIQKKSNIKGKSVNYYSIRKSIKKINKVNLSLLLIDAKKGIDRQDKRIIKQVSERSKKIIIIFNKFDLIKDKKKYKKDTIEYIQHNISQAKNIKIFFISALIKKNINDLLKYINLNIFEKKQSINTSQLNKWLKATVIKSSHPLINNKKLNFKYALQINENPPTIKIFCNYSDKIKKDYKKYLVNSFNKKFKIINQKTNIIFTKTKNPYI